MAEPMEVSGARRWIVRFAIVWIGQSLSLVGSQLVQFALIWWLTKTSGSATVLATATLVGLLPQILLGPFAGTLVDRWNRRLVLIVADSLNALAVLVLAVLFWAGPVEVWQVYLVIFVRSIAGGFHLPAMQASVTLMVPKEHLSRVQGINQMLMGFLNILAAPMGALLLELLPMQGVLAVDVVTALIAVLTLAVVRIPQPGRSAFQAGQATFWRDFVAGFKYVLHWPGLVALLLLSALLNLMLMPATSLLPLLVTEHFARGALQLAWLQSAYGVGMIIGGLALGVWGGFRRRIFTTLAGLVLLGLGLIAMGLLPPWAMRLAIGVAFVIGFAGPIVNGPLIAVFQGTVDPAMQGRVFTLINSVAGAMSPIGLLIAGPVGDLFGVRVWFLISGVFVALMGVVAFFIPVIVHVEDNRQAQPIEREAAQAQAVPPGG